MGVKKMSTNGGNGSSDDDNPKKGGGYKSPPPHGQIKPGEKRNPLGHNGRKKDHGDIFGKVAGLMGPIVINGKAMMVPSEESFWLKQMSLALAGDKAAARNIARELGARRKLGPPPLTAEELAQQAADLAEREKLSATIVDALERMAANKRDEGGRRRVRYGLDGKPIVEAPADDAEPVDSEDPVK
jgi:hypothetical protein